MKRISADHKAVHFQLNERERDALVQILQTYPVLPPAHQPVSKELKKAQVLEYQHLLDEALAEQRAANQRQLHAWLAAPGRFRKTKPGLRLKLERADSEWLFQVLNDVRVGHWLRLGSPEIGEVNPESLAPELVPAWVAMQLSGFFQVSLLEALER